MRYYWIKFTFLIILVIDGAQLLTNNSCECVKFEECGDGIVPINLRIAPECDNYMEICCDLQDIHAVVLKPSPPREGCGYANHEGVIFKIFGNNDNESQFGEFPWMIAVLRRNPNEYNRFDYQNGGSLIHPKVVLTTAGRVSGISPNDLKIRAGEWDRQIDKEPLAHEDRTISEIVVHPDFTRAIDGNNIGLLFLHHPLDFARHIDTICLPPQNYQFDSSNCFVSGWGKSKLLPNNVYANILKKRKLAIVSKNVCIQEYRTATRNLTFNIHGSYMCAGDESNLAVCEGDGGSPLICRTPYTKIQYIQVGIVAMGIDCKRKNVPVLYTELSLYSNWIKNIMNEKNLQYSEF